VRWRRTKKRSNGTGGIGRANVSLRSHAIYVQSYSRSPDGLYVANGWLRIVAEDADNADVGQAILDTLRNTEDNAKCLSGTRERTLFASFHAAGVRSYRQYVTGARSISVATRPQSSSITFVPHRNDLA
jgi:hypothetical protein